MSEVSLFIEAPSIKVLFSRGRRVDKWARMPLEPGLVSDGLIADEEQVAEKLKELFKQQKIGTRTVNAGLSGLNTVYRLSTLPELPEEILPEAVNQEAGRILPVPIDELYLSYQKVPSAPGETVVFISGYPKKNTDAMLSTLGKAGIKAQTVDLAPLALCRTANAPQAIIVDARPSCLDIAILVGQVPQVIRSLPPTGESEPVEERLPSIAEEVERTIAFYNSGHQDNPLPEAVPILVTGELALSPESWPVLSGSHSTTVTELPSPMQAPEGFDASQFITNIGLALKNQPLEKEGSYSIINFNALPEKEKPKGISLSRIMTPIGIVIGAGLIFWLWMQVQDVRSETDLLRQQVEINRGLIPGQQEEIAALEEDIAEIEPLIAPLQDKSGTFAEYFSGLEANRNQVDQDLSGAVALLPAGVYLEDINHNIDQVAIRGTASSEDDVFQYARNLRGSGRYQLVVISSIETDIEEMASGEDEEEEERKTLTYHFRLIPYPEETEETEESQSESEGV